MSTPEATYTAASTAAYIHICVRSVEPSDLISSIAMPHTCGPRSESAVPASEAKNMSTNSAAYGRRYLPMFLTMYPTFTLRRANVRVSLTFDSLLIPPPPSAFWR